MTKLYKKSEIAFAIQWIVAYVVLSSLADQLSESIGVIKSVTAALHICLSLILFFWIRNNHLSEKYGFRKSAVPAKKFLYYLPLAVVASTPFWGRPGLQYGFPGALMFAVSMICVAAIIVSALTFGLGHIVNLVNGSGKDPVSTLIQIVFAVLVGFALVLIFYHGKSLIPCILFHSANNALKVFSAEGTFSPQMELALNLALIVVVLGGYVLYLMKTFPIRPDSRR